jgi:hypothetical protein
VRDPWTKDEVKELQEYFATHIALRKIPVKHEVLNFKQSSSTKRDWQKIKYYVKYLFSKQ